MLYDVSTPKEYLDLLEDDWRKEKLLTLRKMIYSADPTIQEIISYKMLAFGNGHHNAFHLNAQMKYVSLYVGDTTKIDKEGELLKGIDLGKGCIRFKKTTNIEDTQIEAFIKKTIKLWKEGKDIDC